MIFDKINNLPADSKFGLFIKGCCVDIDVDANG
jgi:hypothetical protein